MELKVKFFSALSAKELHDIYRLRVSVFVVEQRCPYQEVDDADERALADHPWLTDLEHRGSVRDRRPGERGHGDEQQLEAARHGRDPSGVRRRSGPVRSPLRAEDQPGDRNGDGGDPGGGHGGAADNAQRADMWALSYSFLWQALGK